MFYTSIRKNSLTYLIHNLIVKWAESTTGDHISLDVHAWWVRCVFHGGNIFSTQASRAKKRQQKITADFEKFLEDDDYDFAFDFETSNDLQKEDKS